MSTNVSLFSILYDVIDSFPRELVDMITMYLSILPNVKTNLFMCDGSNGYSLYMNINYSCEMKKFYGFVGGEFVIIDAITGQFQKDDHYDHYRNIYNGSTQVMALTKMTFLVHDRIGNSEYDKKCGMFDWKDINIHEPQENTTTAIYNKDIIQYGKSGIFSLGLDGKSNEKKSNLVPDEILVSKSYLLIITKNQVFLMTHDFKVLDTIDRSVISQTVNYNDDTFIIHAWENTEMIRVINGKMVLQLLQPYQTRDMINAVDQVYGNYQLLYNNTKQCLLFKNIYNDESYEVDCKCNGNETAFINGSVVYLAHADGIIKFEPGNLII